MWRFSLASLLAVVLLGACDTSIAARREPFPDPLGVVQGVNVVGAAVPILYMDAASAPADNVIPSWWAVARVRRSVAATMRSFDQAADHAGLTQQSDDQAFGCNADGCIRRWSNRDGVLTVVVGARTGTDSRLIANVEWGVHEADASQLVRAAPPPSGYRPSKGLGPGVRRLVTADAQCGRQIGTIESDARSVWRLWNRGGFESYGDESIKAQVDGRTVRQLIQTGFDYYSSATVISGRGLDAPILAVESCS